MPLVRKLPPAVASIESRTFDDEGNPLYASTEFTFSKKIGNHIASRCVEDAVQSLQVIQTTDNPMGLLRSIHAHYWMLNDLRKELSGEIVLLEDVANVLGGGGVAKKSGPVVEAAIFTRAVADALLLAEPDAELDEITEAVDSCRAAANELREDHGNVVRKLDRLDGFCKRLTGLALTRKDLEPYEVLSRFEAPEAWSLPEYRSYNPTELLTVTETWKSRITGTEREVTYCSTRKTYNAEIRLLVQMFLDEEKDQKSARRAQNRKEKRAALKNEISSLWEGR